MTTYQTLLFINLWVLWIVFLVLAYKLYKRSSNTKIHKLTFFIIYVSSLINNILLSDTGFYYTDTTLLYREYIIFPLGIISFSVLALCSKRIIYRIFPVYNKWDDALWHFRSPINKKNIYVIPLLVQVLLFLITMFGIYYYISYIVF